VPVATPLASKEEVKPVALSTTPDTSSKSEPNGLLSWRKRPISESIEAQNELTKIVAHLHLTQKRYGESADSLQAREDAFQRALGRFCIDDVGTATYAYTLEHDDIPTVANILRILEKPAEMPNWAVFTSIEKRREAGEFISDKEREFCRICRQAEVDRVLQDKDRILNLKHRQPMQLAYRPPDEEEAA
jgi:hypothetical protein